VHQAGNRPNRSRPMAVDSRRIGCMAGNSRPKCLRF
jgi:hypothetical protein